MASTDAVDPMKMLAMLALATNPAARLSTVRSSLARAPTPQLKLDAQVREYMRSDVITIGPDATVQKTAEVIMSNKITGVPVVEGGKISGCRLPQRFAQGFDFR
jgi:CBS domain-containing protein